MKIRIGVAATLALVVVLALGPTGPSAAPTVAPTENAVIHWSGVAASAIVVGRPPASSAVLGGMVHGAMYDAVAAIEGGLKPFATGVTAPPVPLPMQRWRRPRGTSSSPACRDRRRPSRARTTPTWPRFPTAPAKDAGKAVGVAAAAGMLAMRTGDHFDDVVPYVAEAGRPWRVRADRADAAGRHQAPVRAAVHVRLALGLPAQGPAELTSKRYAEDVAEMQAYGRTTSAVRTPAQTETVRFHTEQTFFQFNRTVRELAVARGLDLRESARLLGYVYVATADTMIACWEAKYHYSFWRPNHAIQRADTDGNPDTSPDAGWLPLIVGNHPEYPSGHACFTGAVTESLRNYFGTKHVRLVVSSTALGAGPPRTYETLDELVADVENARVWGGLHYRTTMTETAKHFPRIARDVGKKHFLSGRLPGRAGRDADD